ncbi:MAG: hypothetical protein LBT55_01720 [Clostridiaceae bacterium]|jgi:hypothetical protein|nr:hypothetical protein [Clostridiaceae bacterium]
MNDIIDRLTQAVWECFELYAAAVPADSGNLRRNGVRLENTAPGMWEIYMETDITPCAPYTNESGMSLWRSGAKDPNEGWIERVFGEISRRIADELGGERSYEGENNYDSDDD